MRSLIITQRLTRKAHVSIECWIVMEIRVVYRTVMNTQYLDNIKHVRIIRIEKKPV